MGVILTLKIKKPIRWSDDKRCQEAFEAGQLRQAKEDAEQLERWLSEVIIEVEED